MNHYSVVFRALHKIRWCRTRYTSTDVQHTAVQQKLDCLLKYFFPWIFLKPHYFFTTKFSSNEAKSIFLSAVSQRKMALRYQVYGTQVWYQDKDVCSFPTPQETDYNLNVLTETRTSWAVISFPSLTGSLDPLTSSCDPLEVSVISTAVGTLPSTVLEFPQNMDFLLSAVIILRANLYFFLLPLFEKVLN